MSGWPVKRVPPLNLARLRLDHSRGAVKVGVKIHTITFWHDHKITIGSCELSHMRGPNRDGS